MKFALPTIYDVDDKILIKRDINVYLNDLVWKFTQYDQTCDKGCKNPLKAIVDRSLWKTIGEIYIQ